MPLAQAQCALEGRTAGPSLFREDLKMKISQKLIRWVDWIAMAGLAAVVVYRFALPHPTQPLPSPGVVVVETHGKPVLVDLSSTR